VRPLFLTPMAACHVGIGPDSVSGICPNTRRAACPAGLHSCVEMRESPNLKALRAPRPDVRNIWYFNRNNKESCLALALKVTQPRLGSSHDAKTGLTVNWSPQGQHAKRSKKSRIERLQCTIKPLLYKQ